MTSNRPVVSLLVTDVDNTLFDWLAMWHAAFGAMMAEVSRISGIPQSDLEPEIRRIHQHQGTVEFAFLLEAMPSLRLPNGSTSALREMYSTAVDAYRSNRDEMLRPYPGVTETLRAVRDRGCLVVAYTESLRFQSTLRFKKLGFDGLIDFLYSPGDLALPDDRPDLIGHRREALESLVHTKHRTTPPGELKPNPALLLDIIREVGGQPRSTVYVGDNLLKDVWMAQHAGVHDVYAAYGAPPARPEYELLRRVSHWPDRQISEERATVVVDIKPRFTLEQSYGELLDQFDFTEARR